MNTGTRSEVDTVAVHIPMRFERRGGRKLILAPDGAMPAKAKPDRDETLIRALVKAHRCWRRIESGRANSITDLAAQEDVPVLRSSGAAAAEGGTDAHVCRLLPLTCLAPEIVEAILDGKQPKGLRLAPLLRSIPLAWEQRFPENWLMEGDSNPR